MRRRKYIEHKKNLGKKKHKLLYYALFLTILLLIVGVITFVLNLVNLDKYSFVTKNKDNSTDIYIVDTKNSLVKRYSMSGDILVDSSLNYGEYTLSNLWTLAKNENLNGDLVARTIVKNFSLPVYYYLDENRTNMNLVYLAKSKYILIDKKNIDGSITSERLSKSILVDFVDNKIQEDGTEVVIYDNSGGNFTSEKISEVVNILGSKVVDYQRSYDPSLYCTVEGNENLRLTKVLVNIFGCDFVKTVNNKKVVIKIGEKFLSDF